MTLDEKLIEMLKAGYEIHFDWEPNPNAYSDEDRLVLTVLKGNRRAKARFSRVELELLTCPDMMILTELIDIEEWYMGLGLEAE